MFPDFTFWGCFFFRRDSQRGVLRRHSRGLAGEAISTFLERIVHASLMLHFWNWRFAGNDRMKQVSWTCTLSWCWDCECTELCCDCECLATLLKLQLKYFLNMHTRLMLGLWMFERAHMVGATLLQLSFCQEWESFLPQCVGNCCSAGNERVSWTCTLVCVPWFPCWKAVASSWNENISAFTPFQVFLGFLFSTVLYLGCTQSTKTFFKHYKFKKSCLGEYSIVSPAVCYSPVVIPHCRRLDDFLHSYERLWLAVP